jgi:hypothetical protein
MASATGAAAYYDILSAASGKLLSVASAASDIRAAYLKACLTLHPDKAETTKGTATREEWHSLRKAYLVLGDAERRARYDAGESIEVEDHEEELLKETPKPGATSSTVTLFKGNAKLVDHGDKISLFTPVMKRMSRKLKPNRHGSVSYVSKNKVAGHSLNVLFHDGEWKWLRSKRVYEPQDLVDALETEQRLSQIGLDAFGLSAGHTQDWLKGLERDGYGQTPEGRGQLLQAASLVYGDVKAITENPSPNKSDAAEHINDRHVRSEAPVAQVKSGSGCSTSALVPIKQEQMMQALRHRVDKDEGLTLEAQLEASGSLKGFF